MQLIPFEGQKLPDCNAEGTRHTVQKPDGLFGDLVAGYVYGKDIDEVAAWVKANVPDARTVANRTEIREL